MVADWRAVLERIEQWQAFPYVPSFKCPKCGEDVGAVMDLVPKFICSKSCGYLSASIPTFFLQKDPPIKSQPGRAAKFLGLNPKRSTYERQQSGGGTQN